MSIKLFNLVLKHATYKGNTRMALMVIASHANDQGVCWPGMRLLCAETGQTVRTMTRSLKQLYIDGILSAGSSPGPGKNTILKLNLDILDGQNVHRSTVDISAERWTKKTETVDKNVSVIRNEPSRTIKRTVSKTLRSPKAHAVKTHSKPGKAAAVEPADPRFQPCMEILKRYWDYMNRDTGVAFAPTPADCKALKDFLRDNRKTEPDVFMRCLGYRAKSEGVIPPEPIRLWIKNSLRYAAGPVTQYNRLASDDRELKSKAERRSDRIRERTARLAGESGEAAGDIAGSLPAGDFGGREPDLAGGPAPLQLRGDSDSGNGSAAAPSAAAAGERRDPAMARDAAGERPGPAHRGHAPGKAAGDGQGAPARAGPRDG